MAQTNSIAISTSRTTKTRAMAHKASRNAHRGIRRAIKPAIAAGILAFVAVLVAYFGFGIDPAMQANIVKQRIVNKVAFTAQAGNYGNYSTRYVYTSLEPRLQQAYSSLYEAAFLQRSEVSLDGYSDEELSNIMYAVWYDSPELFFVDPAVTVHTTTTNTMSEHTTSTVSFTYLYSEDELDDVRAAYERGIEEASAIAENCQSDANKVNMIHGWVLENVTYDENASTNPAVQENAEASDGSAELEPLPESATAYGALNNGTATCGGYSQVFCAICRASGIDCRTIIGSVDGSDIGHAWNAVYVGDSWRYIDTTWNDENDDAHTYYLASETEFTVSGHHAFENNVPVR